MLPSLPQPRYMPCSDCGESVSAELRDEHVCDVERWVTYQLFRLRHDVAALDDEIAAYLDTPSGRFELWDAAWRRELEG